MDRRWGIHYLLIIGFVLFFAAPWAWAQPNRSFTTVYTVGDSAIRGDDMSASLKEAINGSLIAAVTRVLTDMVPQDVLVGNFQVINEQILNRSEAFVQNYKVMTESIHDKRHRVMVQVSVSNQRLKNALKKRGIYVGKKPYPRVLFCIAEKPDPEGGFEYWWSEGPQTPMGAATKTVQQLLRNKGFTMVAPRKSAGSRNYPPELSVPEAVALGQQLNAQVVVVGQAVADEASNTMGGTIQSFRATLVARAYRVDSSEMLAQTQQSALNASEDTQAGITAAMEKAALLTGEDLAMQIAEAWFNKQSDSARTEITIEGIGGNIANFVKFRGALSAISGVENVQLKEMMPNAAVLSVAYQGSARTLADDLLLQNYGTFGINIIESDARMIRLELLSR